MAEQTAPGRDFEKPKLDFKGVFYSQAVRGIAYQVLLACAVILCGFYLYDNVTENLSRQGIATGFDFLTEKSGFDIGQSVVPFDSDDTYGRALWVGVLNTLTVAACGIVLATFLGVAMGIARVSTNWFAAKFSSAYVEIVRNVPVVLHVIFWAAFLRNLPGPKQSWTPFEGLYLNNRGLIFATPVANSVYTWVGLALIVGIIAAYLFARWAQLRREKTGIFVPTLWPVLGIIFGLPLLTWLIGGAPLIWDMPVFRGFNFRGGASLTPEFVGLLIGITVYTAAFIAEIVRAGIQSVASGQIEAARSLGLRPGWIMRYVTLPQALRVIVPPATSQYLSLTKNSSLGVLIGYPDLVNVGNTTLNQTGQAVEAIAIMMMVYLIISLTISTVMNIYNRSIVLTER